MILLLHGAVGILDEVVLIVCILVIALALVSFYVVELRKTRKDK